MLISCHAAQNPITPWSIHSNSNREPFFTAKPKQFWIVYTFNNYFWINVDELLRDSLDLSSNYSNWKCAELMEFPKKKCSKNTALIYVLVQYALERNICATVNATSNKGHI